ncbi:MAG: hypothetical protein P4L99_28365 [Chthoniobacter sp.]|nr:hypothetical protein [Chthoniobacter sp.]
MNYRTTLQSARLSLLALVIALFLPQAARAVPSYARQTGMSCIACHTEFPLLTEFGRQFKLNGYTLSTGQTELPPIAFMLQPSFTQTNKGQPGGAAPHFADNSNVALSQASVFYSGRLFGPYAESLFGPTVGGFLNKIGTFSQLTYDGVAQQLHWDNVEIRYADTKTLFSKPVTFGIYSNNNPGMQDPWNGSPIWGFPFSSSSLAPTPGADTLINGALAQQVVGVGAYAMLNNSFYLDIAGYHTLSRQVQYSMGIDPTDETQVPGIAPYWRFAYEKSSGNQAFQVGFFGMTGRTYPGRDNSAGKDRLTDWGVDTQYQVSMGKSDVTFLASAIYERENWSASQQLGNTTNTSDHLWSTKATLDYLYDKTYGGAISYFATTGSQDAALYSGSANASPLSDGLVLQVNYMPLNKGGGPAFWPKSNVKLSVQYVIYNRFNGTRTNYDGAGRNASDNNTLYVEAWFAF